MFVCTTALYDYLHLLGNDVHNLFVNAHVRIKIYWEFYHNIIYLANEGSYFRIKHIAKTKAKVISTPMAKTRVKATVSLSL